MRVGFLILAHKNKDQLLKLVNTLLCHEGSFVVIHVDKKSSSLYNELLAYCRSNERISMIRDRETVFWGSFQQIMATVKLMREGIKFDPDYLCLLSAQDLPIQPLPLFHDFLERQKGKEFIVTFGLPSTNWENGGKYRMGLYYFNHRYYPRLTSKISTLINQIQIKLKLFRRSRFNYYGGTNWFCLSKEAVNYVLEFVNTNPSFVRRFRFTRCADEMFVQSILANSKFKDRIISDDLRMVDWGTGPEYPRVFRINDMDRLINNDAKFFARKFDDKIDSEIISLLHERCMP